MAHPPVTSSRNAPGAALPGEVTMWRVEDGVLSVRDGAVLPEADVQANGGRPIVAVTRRLRAPSIWMAASSAILFGLCGLSYFYLSGTDVPVWWFPAGLGGLALCGCLHLLLAKRVTIRIGQLAPTLGKWETVFCGVAALAAWTTMVLVVVKRMDSGFFPILLWIAGGLTDLSWTGMVGALRCGSLRDGWFALRGVPREILFDLAARSSPPHPLRPVGRGLRGAMGVEEGAKWQVSDGSLQVREGAELPEIDLKDPAAGPLDRVPVTVLAFAEGRFWNWWGVVMALLLSQAITAYFGVNGVDRASVGILSFTLIASVIGLLEARRATRVRIILSISRKRRIRSRMAGNILWVLALLAWVVVILAVIRHLPHWPLASTAVATLLTSIAFAHRRGRDVMRGKGSRLDGAISQGSPVKPSSIC